MITRKKSSTRHISLKFIDEQGLAPLKTSPRKRKATGPSVNRGLQAGGLIVHPTKKFCTACSIDAVEGTEVVLVDHPLLKVPVCTRCLGIYSLGEFVVLDPSGNESFCRWCGDGGNLIGCDSCFLSFCEDCIDRNFGRSVLNDIIAVSRWECFVCDSSLLNTLQATFEKDLPKRRDFNVDSTRSPSHTKRCTTLEAQSTYLPIPHAIRSEKLIVESSILNALGDQLTIPMVKIASGEVCAPLYRHRLLFTASGSPPLNVASTTCISSSKINNGSRKIRSLFLQSLIRTFNASMSSLMPSETDHSNTTW
jgi:hypothetical protein